MIRLTCSAMTIAMLVACSGAPETVSETDKVSINCFAAKTVIKITDQAKVAILDGQSGKQLRKLQDDAIAEGAVILTEQYPKDMHEAYFEFETMRRLTAMQNALSNRAPNSPDQKTMDETIELAASCEF